MVHRRCSAIIFLTTAFCLVDSALGGLLSREGAAPTLKVLTGTASNACTPQKVAVIKERLAETITLVEDASKALKVKGVETSDSFRSFLGNAKPDEMDTLHYGPVARLRNVILESVTSDQGHAANQKATAPATETLFEFLDPSDERCSLPGNPSGRANGLIALADTIEHTVKFCPTFFEKTANYHPTGLAMLPTEPISLAAGKAKYLAAGGNDVFYTRDVIYFMPAVTFLHEFQHSPSVVGKDFVYDLFVRQDAQHIVVPAPKSPVDGIIPVYTMQACMGLPADQKRKNAQNIAMFALDVHADPKRGFPQVSGVAAADQTGKKTSKRFEAIYQRGAEQRAAAEKQGTKDTTPKPATSGDGTVTNKGKTEQAYASKYKRPEFGLAPPISDVEGQE